MDEKKTGSPEHANGPTDRAPASRGPNRWATASIVLAIVELLAAVVAFAKLLDLSNHDRVLPAQLAGYLYPVLAVTVVVVGWVGRRNARRYGGRGKTSATVAIAVGCAEVLFAVWLALAVTGCVKDAFHCR
jgi:uncharacterized membrane protein